MPQNYSPCIIFVTAAAKTDMDRIWVAMGRQLPGGASFIRKCCAIDPLADHNTPATHYMCQDESATVEDEAIWRALISSQDLPEIEGIWGEDGIISAQDAMTAATTANVVIFSRVGDLTEPQVETWKDGCFATMGLQFVPDPEP